jgi:hypothetical protein
MTTMKSSRPMRFPAPKGDKTPEVPLAERGRMLFVRDVQALFPTKPDGSPLKSAWWVKNNFAPAYKHRLGRDPYWWECDAVRWLDAQKDVA